MEKISLEDKKRICARAFYQDNNEGENAYEDYHEALADFMGEKSPPENFINFVVGNFTKHPGNGYKLFMNDEGHVATVRLSDGFFEPRTEMTKDDGDKLHEAFEKASDENPDVAEIDILPLIGWREI